MDCNISSDIYMQEKCLSLFTLEKSIHSMYLEKCQ